MLLLFLVLVQLVRIQIVGVVAGRALAQEAVNQRTPGIPLEVARGDILDRNQESLTGEGTRWSVVAFPQIVRQWPDIPRHIAHALNIDLSTLHMDITGWNGPLRVQIAGEVDEQLAETIAEASWPGMVAVQDHLRYGHDALARHIVGYIRPNAYCHPQDNVGEMGLEARYNHWLKGYDPMQLVACVDANHHLIDGLGYRIRPSTDSVAHSVCLTIDAEFQRIVEEEMDRAGVCRGAVLILDPYSGAVLAMASRPNFDQNHPEAAFATQNALINAAVSPYLPGSIFKLVVAAAALQEGRVSTGDAFLCNGSMVVGGRTFQCTRAHGELTFEEAFAHSCNVVFIQLAKELGPALLTDYAHALGLGMKTGLEVDGESSGSLPLARTMGEQDVANLALGQGDTTITPLQAAVLVATLVNDGVRPVPWLVQEVSNEVTGQLVWKREPPSGVRVLGIDTARTLRLLMFHVTTYGTGQDAQIVQRAAGKTGSAQTLTGSPSHAWFAGFSPFYVPRYVMVVFAERAGAGGTVAAPLFAAIMSRILAGT